MGKICGQWWITRVSEVPGVPPYVKQMLPPPSPHRSVDPDRLTHLALLLFETAQESSTSRQFGSQILEHSNKLNKCNVKYNTPQITQTPHTPLLCLLRYWIELKNNRCKLPQMNASSMVGIKQNISSKSVHLALPQSYHTFKVPQPICFWVSDGKSDAAPHHPNTTIVV